MVCGMLASAAWAVGAARAGSVAQDYADGPSLQALDHSAKRLAAGGRGARARAWPLIEISGGAMSLRQPVAPALSTSAPTMASLIPAPIEIMSHEPTTPALLMQASEEPARAALPGVRYHEDFEGGSAGEEWGGALPVTRSEEFTSFAGPFGEAALTLSVRTRPGAGYTLAFDLVLPGAPGFETSMDGTLGVSLGELELLCRDVQDLRAEQAAAAAEGEPARPRVVRHVCVPFIADSETTTLRFAGAVVSGEPGAGWGIDNVIIDGGEQSSTSGFGEASLVRGHGFLSTVPILSPDLGGGPSRQWDLDSPAGSGDSGGGGGGGGGDGEFKSLPAPGALPLVVAFFALTVRRRS